MGKPPTRHTSREFVSFLIDVVATRPAEREIHIILDNLSAHKTPLVNQILDQHRNVQLHFTPTYSSWLSQVEIWFSKLEREVIARGIFTSVSDLRHKIMRYIRLYGKSAKPFRWKYSDLKRRIQSWQICLTDSPLVGNLRPIGNRPVDEFGITYGRRLTICPTSLQLAPEEVDRDRDYVGADGMFAIGKQPDFELLM